jgi:hypothetical protein
MHSIYRGHLLLSNPTLAKPGTAYCVLRTAYCVLRTAYCVLRTAYCVLHTAYCVLRPAYCVLRTAYCVLHTAYCVLRTAYCVLRTAYCVLRTAAGVDHLLSPYSLFFLRKIEEHLLSPPVGTTPAVLLLPTVCLGTKAGLRSLPWGSSIFL